MTSQDGMATVSQLASCGLSRAAVRARVDRGEWERLALGVVGHAGLAMSWRRRCRLALLMAGAPAALGAASAARLHQLDGYDRDERIVVCFPGERRPGVLPNEVVGRGVRWLSAGQCTTVEGLRCVIRPVVLVQIAAEDGRDAAAQALDSMLRNGDSPTWVRQVCTPLRRHGVAGPGLVMRLLDERVDGRLPRSWFQRLAKRFLDTQGIRLVDEHPVRNDDGRIIAELDLAAPDLKIGIECQSWRWHATPGARARDAARKRQLRQLGWEIVEVWWSDLDDLSGVEADLRHLVDTRRPTLF